MDFQKISAVLIGNATNAEHTNVVGLQWSVGISFGVFIACGCATALSGLAHLAAYSALAVRRATLAAEAPALHQQVEIGKGWVSAFGCWGRLP